MSFFQQIRKALIALVLVLVLTTATACGGATTAKSPTSLPGTAGSLAYTQLERGNSAVGQEFGTWVMQTAKGLVQDAYVRDDNKLGVVITPKVSPNEVKDLARSLAQGFHHNFPNQDVSVLVYAPDKKLIMTAKYDQQSNKIDYKAG